MLRERLKEEGLRRLKMLRVHSNVIKDFEKDELNYSERQNQYFPAVLYWVSNRPEVEKVIDNFEKEYGCYVYHAQLTHMREPLGSEMWTFLYVSKDEEEWERDREDLKEGMAYAYVWHNEIKEIGMVGVEPKHGGVLRTW